MARGTLSKIMENHVVHVGKHEFCHRLPLWYSNASQSAFYSAVQQAGWIRYMLGFLG
jgi:hypothetical protein